MAGRRCLCVSSLDPRWQPLSALCFQSACFHFHCFLTIAFLCFHIFFSTQATAKTIFAFLSSTFISTSTPPIFLLPLLASDLLTDSNACDVMLRNGALYQHSVSLLGMWHCDIKNVSNCLDFCRLGQDKGQQCWPNTNGVPSLDFLILAKFIFPLWGLELQLPFWCHLLPMSFSAAESKVDEA